MKIFTATLDTPMGPVEIDATAFRPDWQEFWTIKEMESQLVQTSESAEKAAARVWLETPSARKQSFKFKGPGWYLGDNNQLLVIPTPQMRLVDDTKEQVFLVCVWDSSQAGPAFNWIVNAPVKTDDR